MFYLLIVLWGMILQAENPWSGLSDGVKDVLVGKMHKDLSVPLHTQEAMPILMEANKVQLQKDILSLEDAEEKVCDKFRVFLEGKDRDDGGWVKSVEDIKALAAIINPESKDMQKHSVIHMILSYVQESLKNNIHNTMFGCIEMPGKEMGRFNLSYLGSNKPLGVEFMVGPKMRYLIRDAYEFSMLEWFCAQEEDVHLLVIPEDWTKEWKAHRQDYQGLLNVVKLHDGAHAGTLESLSILMQSVSDNFAEKRNKAIRETLYEMWPTCGPKAIVGGFFLFHEIVNRLIDTQEDVFLDTFNVEEKVIRILQGVSSRALLDEGFFDLLKDMGVAGEVRADDVRALSLNFLEVFLKHFAKGPILRPAPHPHKVIEQEWLDGEDLSTVSFRGLVKKICTYINVDDAEYARLFPPSFLDPEILCILNREKGEFIRSTAITKKSGIQGMFFIPTREVVASYTPLQKRFMLQDWSVAYNGLIGSCWFQMESYYPHLTPDVMLKSLSPELIQECFGVGVKAEGVASTEGFWSVWGDAWNDVQEARMQSQQLKHMEDALKGTIFAEKISALCAQMRVDFGSIADLAKLYLSDLYLQAYRGGRANDPVMQLFHSKQLPSKEDLKAFQLPNGEYLIEALQKHQEHSWSVVLFARKATILEKVIALQNCLYIVEDVGVVGGVPLYKQYDDMHHREAYRNRWVEQKDVLFRVIEEIKCHWSQGGFYAFCALGLLWDNMMQLSCDGNIEDTLLALKDMHNIPEKGLVCVVKEQEEKLQNVNVANEIMRFLFGISLNIWVMCSNGGGVGKYVLEGTQ